MGVIKTALNFDIRTLFKDGRLRPMKELTRAEAFMICGFEVRGRGRSTVVKVKLEPRFKYAELAARCQGMLQDNLNVTGDWDKLEARLKGARAKVIDMPPPEKNVGLDPPGLRNRRPIRIENARKRGRVAP